MLITVISGNSTSIRHVQVNIGFVDLSHYQYYTQTIVDFSQLTPISAALSIIDQDCLAFGFSHLYLTSSPA